MTFPRSRFSDQHYRFIAVDIAAFRQLADLGRRDLRRLGEVELFQCFQSRHLRIANPVIDRVPVALFSDLLLHDIGTGDDIPQAGALPEEIRTPALWGVRLRRPLLHDGSAATLDEAIARHRGEAERARRGFDALAPADRAAVLAFLRSL